MDRSFCLALVKEGICQGVSLQQRTVLAVKCITVQLYNDTVSVYVYNSLCMCVGYVEISTDWDSKDFCMLILW